MNLARLSGLFVEVKFIVGGEGNAGDDREFGSTGGEWANKFARLPFGRGTASDMEEENEVGESESDGLEEQGDGIGDSVRSTTPRRGLGMGKAFVTAASVALERAPTDKELRGARETSKEVRRGECTWVCSWLREHAEH